MPSIPQQQYQQQNIPASYQVSGGPTKTTVFLPDGGYLDGGINNSLQQQPQNSTRIYVSLTPTNTSTTLNNKSTPTPIQYPGHHRDKLDLIRDSLKPFEQCSGNGSIFYCNSVNNIAISNGNYFDADNVSNDANTSAGEPSEEIQKIMIHALTQGGYDKESAYYALKLVNFTSVMDAAKVLSSIKQNLQNTHNNNGTHFQQQMPISVPYCAGTASISIGNYSSENPNQNLHQNSSNNVINANLLSSNGRAALSRYGVVSDHNMHPTTSTTLSVGGPKVLANNQQPLSCNFQSQQPSQQYKCQQQSYFTGDKSPMKLGTNNDFGNYNIQLGLDDKSGSISPTIQGSLLVDVNTPNGPSVVRTPSPNFRQQQQKRRPRLGGGYILPNVKHSHVVLRHSNSFDPADHMESKIPSIHQSRQHQTTSGTVIKIDRIASERIQSSAALNNALSYSTSLSSTPKRLDQTYSDTSSQMDNSVESARQKITQLQLKPSYSAPISPGVSTKLLRTTTFSQQKSINQQDQQQVYNSNSRSNLYNSSAIPSQDNNRLRSATASIVTTTTTDPVTTSTITEQPTAVQSIFVDPDTPTPESSQCKGVVTTATGRGNMEPPNYGNYINQLNQQTQQHDHLDNEVFAANYTNVKRVDEQQTVHRCCSPLPKSIENRLKTQSYERFVKSCKAAMFRFFMEQHIEKLIQQYRERNQRAIQLTREMEAAELAETMKEQMLRLLRQKESKYIRLKRQKMNKNMFDMIRHIGVGAFGKVTLVRKKDTGQIYAMKTLSKEYVIQKQQAAHVKAERDILAEANSTWIVKLFFSFQDAQNLYFIMEYVPGGDMMQLLINKGIFSERLARFYIAELTCAIEYVHSLGFIHRDIKPDNILIDKNGHIKLTDFGLCTGLRWTHDKRHYVIYDDDVPSLSTQHLREDSFSLPLHLENSKEKVKLLEYRHHKKRNQAHSVVGTGNYMAPEVIKKTGHTQLCDWWSVGVILYEMVYGSPPFMSHDDKPGETQYMIVNWRRFLDLDNPMGARLSSNCINFIARLCCDQEMRLGRGGAKEIKAHLWFKGIDFANLRSTRAEYIPRVEHAEDTSNFDTFEVNAEELFKTSHQQNSNGSNHQQPYNAAFFDFTFRHFFASEGIHGIGVNAGNVGGGTRQQLQRPSLAPLIEQANNKNGNSSYNNGDAHVGSEKSDINIATKTMNSNIVKVSFQGLASKKTPAPLAPNKSIQNQNVTATHHNNIVVDNRKNGDYNEYESESNHHIPSSYVA